MTEKKQIRCINCNNIIATGHIKEGVIEINCRHCPTKNRIEAVKEHAEVFGNMVIKGDALHKYTQAYEKRHRR